MPGHYPRPSRKTTRKGDLAKTAENTRPDLSLMLVVGGALIPSGPARSPEGPRSVAVGPACTEGLQPVVRSTRSGGRGRLQVLRCPLVWGTFWMGEANEVVTPSTTAAAYGWSALGANAERQR